MRTTSVAMAPKLTRNAGGQLGVDECTSGRRRIRTPEPRRNRRAEIGDEERRNERKRRKLTAHSRRQPNDARRIVGILRETKRFVRDGESGPSEHEVEDPRAEQPLHQRSGAPSANRQAQGQEGQSGTTLRGALECTALAVEPGAPDTTSACAALCLGRDRLPT